MLLLVTAMAILEVQAVALVAVMAAAPGKGVAVGLVIRNNLSKVKNMQQQKRERQAEKSWNLKIVCLLWACRIRCIPFIGSSGGLL